MPSRTWESASSMFIGSESSACTHFQIMEGDYGVVVQEQCTRHDVTRMQMGADEAS